MVLQSTGVKNISGIHCWEGAKGSLSLFLSLQSLSLSLSHSLTPPPWLNEMSSTSAALTALPSNPMQWLITDIPEGKQAKGGNDQREEGKQTLEHKSQSGHSSHTGMLTLTVLHAHHYSDPGGPNNCWNQLICVSVCSNLAAFLLYIYIICLVGCSSLSVVRLLFSLFYFLSFCSHFITIRASQFGVLYVLKTFCMCWKHSSQSSMQNTSSTSSAPIIPGIYFFPHPNTHTKTHTKLPPPALCTEPESDESSSLSLPLMDLLLACAPSTLLLGPNTLP